MSPVLATVPAGATQLFVATVSGSANTAVSWQVDGVPGGNSAIGTIDPNGLYHAPNAPTAAPVTVTAVSQADTSKSGHAEITIAFTAASIAGDYVFLVNSGKVDSVTGQLGFSYAGGTFHADGLGNITAGVEDRNTSAGGPVTGISFTGSYTLNADTRGTATIADGTTSTIFKFVLTSSDRGQMIEFDGLSAANGFFLRQDPAVIANVTGPYVFSLLGADAGAPIGIIGRLISDGAGNLSGSEIMNDAGTANNLTLTGTYTVGSGGRGTATVTNALNTTQHFIFYIVNANTVEFIGIDNATLPRLAGTAFLQTGSGTSIGSSAFFVDGLNVPGTSFTAAGRFDTDGAGTITGGIFDEFNPVHITGAPIGKYSINPDGSGQIPLLNPGPSFDFWMFSPTQAVVLTRPTIPANQSTVAIGLISAEQGGPFTAAQFIVNYAYTVASYIGLGATGRVTGDGIATFTGIEDITGGGTTLADQAVNATWTIVNGQGLGQETVGNPQQTPLPFRFYPISPNEVIICIDNLMGLAEKQCAACH
ncbi:MAG TPA: hypothetical protein VFL42_05180 [Terriglobales bacterium]|nr:hypothetical protein [Terriglobales bacterium]